jgi:protein-glutamine gamma-glutamyltransferase
VSFARQKRLLLGGLALLAPLPLPFNEQLEWLFLAAYGAIMVLFLRRADLDAGRWLPAWGANLLAVAYAPVLYFDVTRASGGAMLRPLLHLAMFALVAKLFGLQRERDKWHATLGIFFVFLAAMGTSVHPTIVLYLAAFVPLMLLMLARFAYFHLLAGFGHRDREPSSLPLKGFLGGATVVSLAVAVPLFIILPRVRTPYIVGPGAGTGTQVLSGFSDEMSLDFSGSVRDNRAVALRLQFEKPLRTGQEIRFKGATYDVYRGRAWSRSPRRPLPPIQGGVFRIAPGPVTQWVRVWRQPLQSTAVPAPVETVLLDFRATQLELDAGGAVTLSIPPLETLEYRARMGAAPISAALPPAPDAVSSGPALQGVTPGIAALAGQVAGEGSAAQRAERIETHLIQGYAYTLEQVGRGGAQPIDDFLFRVKAGHCEYFGSAMVLMLRAQGIPARLVTGFLGAEYNPLEGYFIVRQSNAHAWVEAWLGEGRGWAIFDPTPPAGRPVSARASLGLFMTQAYDYLVFRWDRYVLTYGFEDQLRAFARLRRMWFDVWRRFQRPDVAEPPEQVKAPAGGLPDVTESTDTAGQ